MLAKIKNVFISKLFLSFVFLHFSLDYCHTSESPKYDSVPEWDIIIFTQQWPETVCKLWEEKDPSHKCIMPNPQDLWTIHGIWPTKLGTKGPGFCNSSWHFDQDKVKPIESLLIELWPPVESRTAVYSLWAHEWSKHGTCAAVLETLNSELKYFSQGLDWLKKYSMSNILKEASIVPSNTNRYAVADINNAVKVSLGVNPAVECRVDKGVTYLLEIRICFDKKLGLTDCDGIVSEANPIITNCHGDVLYIIDFQPPNFFYVQLYKIISWLQWLTL